MVIHQCAARTTTTQVSAREFPFCCLIFCETSCGRPIVLHATGAARRRRERRLRAYMRYARMGVEMALAECQHHSAQRQKKARFWEEEREMHCTAAFRTTVPPPEPELFELFEEPGGVRPNLLLEPQVSQERVLQHTREHAGAICPFDSRCSCSADGGSVAEYRSVLRRTPTCSRAGYRSAQDLASRCSSATLLSRAAAGGTAGSSANDHFLFLAAADCGAER